MSAKKKITLEIEDISIPVNKKKSTQSRGGKSNADFELVKEDQKADKVDINNKSDNKKPVSSLNKSYSTNIGTTSVFQSLEVSETIVVNSPLYKMDQNRHIEYMSSYLVCLLGPEELVGRYWKIEDNKKIIIGRNRKCDISIQNLSISKKHLRLRSDGFNFFVEDQKSTNGTFINDKQIKARKVIKLEDNSKVKLGNIVFKFLNKGNPEIISMIENFEKVSRDPLTGVGNKFMLDRRAKEIFTQSKTCNTPMSLIMFDIDHFKKVNDTYGHLAGDFILKEMVQLTKSCFRSNDLFIRCGGEEFCIIMQSLIDRAESAIENARKKLEAELFKYKEHNIKITISAGVTCQKRMDKRWREIYERADKLLYKAKTTGRNKVFASI